MAKEQRLIIKMTARGCVLKKKKTFEHHAIPWTYYRRCKGRQTGPGAMRKGRHSKTGLGFLACMQGFGGTLSQFSARQSALQFHQADLQGRRVAPWLLLTQHLGECICNPPVTLLLSTWRLRLFCNVSNRMSSSDCLQPPSGSPISATWPLRRTYV
jgi:hypothetical protein